MTFPSEPAAVGEPAADVASSPSALAAGAVTPDAEIPDALTPRKGRPLLVDRLPAGLLGLSGLLEVVGGAVSLVGAGPVPWWVGLAGVAVGAASIRCSWHLIVEVGHGWWWFALAVVLFQAAAAYDAALVDRPWRGPGPIGSALLLAWGVARAYGLRRLARGSSSARMRA